MKQMTPRTNRGLSTSHISLFVIVAAAVLVPALPASASQFYVAPNGSASGNGSINQPWDLGTALAQPASVQPGDTMWVRGGVHTMSYPDQYTSYLTGTASAPIVVRAYPGEHPIVDLGNLASALYVNGAYTWFWGLEITATGIPGPRPFRFLGRARCHVEINGVGVKFINCFVHDLSQGFSFWSPSEGSELYGNIVFHNGWEAPDRGHGHNLYVQNDSSGLYKTISDNFIGAAFDVGIQEYGSGGAWSPTSPPSATSSGTTGRRWGRRSAKSLSGAAALPRKALKSATIGCIRSS